MSKLSLAIVASAGVSGVSGSVAGGSQGFLGFMQTSSEVQHLSETAITHVNGLECTQILMDNKNVCVYPKAAYDFPELREAIPDFPALNVKCGEGFSVVAGYKLRMTEDKGEPEIRACASGEKSCGSENQLWDYIYALCAAPVHKTRELPKYRAITSQGGATEQLACLPTEHMTLGVSYRIAAERLVYSLDACNNQSCPETKEQLTGDRVSVAFCHEGPASGDRLPLKTVTAGPFFDVHEGSTQSRDVSCGDNKDYFVAAGTLSTASLRWAVDCFASEAKLERSLAENIATHNPYEHESRHSCHVKAKQLNYPMAMLLCGSNTLPDQIDPVWANSWNATFTNAYASLANAASGLVDQTFLAASDGYNYYNGTTVSEVHSEEIVVPTVEAVPAVAAAAPEAALSSKAAVVEINAHAEAAPVAAGNSTSTTTLSDAEIAEAEAHRFVAEHGVVKVVAPAF